MSTVPALQWRGDAGSELLRREVEAALAEPARAVLVRGLPDAEDSAPLLRLAAALGHFLTLPPDASPAELARQVVAIRTRDHPTVRQGLEQQSESSLALHMHTDGAGMERPFDLILLHCIVPDPAGGHSLIAPLDRILSHLAPVEVRLLKAPLFPFPWGFGPILYGDECDPRIRFHRVYLEAGAERHGVKMDHRLLALMSRLGAIARADEVMIRCAAAPGECLVVDNTRTLHGRTALQPRSPRYVKRVRVFGHPA